MWFIYLNEEVTEDYKDLITTIMEYLSTQVVDKIYLKCPSKYCWRNYVVPLVQYILNNLSAEPIVIMDTTNKYHLDFCEKNNIKLLSDYDINNYIGYVLDTSGNIIDNNNNEHITIAKVENNKITFFE